MSSHSFVRPARESDVDAVVGIQVAAWRSMYGPLLPADVVDELVSEEAAERFRAQWHASVRSPPTSTHRLLVATEELATAPGGRAVVGFTACGPAQDPDLWPGTDAEVYALHVHPDHTRSGHGSRLLNAAVDHLVDDGFRTAHLWTLANQNALGDFVRAAGWRPDGARRELDVGVAVPMLRLHASIAEG